MDVTQTAQGDACATNVRLKPAVPKKPEKLTLESDVKRTTHVRDMIRRLQERERSAGAFDPAFVKTPGKGGNPPPLPDKPETDASASRQTLEDLKAIDEDIEKLRRQIAERDKIISDLREAAEAKDKKLDDFVAECAKLRSRGGPGAEPSSEPPTSPSSDFCSDEPCWTDDFAGANYRGLLRDRLQGACGELGKKLGSSGGAFETPKEDAESPKPERESKSEGGENAINLIMAEQIRLLKEREAQLIWEAEELREQNDLMEFRILELEESRKEFLDKEMLGEGKHRAEKIVWRERDLEEVSDSGVVSLPTSEDLTSDSELGDAIRNYSPLGAFAHLGLSASDSSNSDPGVGDLKLKKSLKSAECLQESGIFVDAESPDCAISGGSHSKACQTEPDLDKAILDIIDSSCDLFLAKNPAYLEDFKSDDLTTEISKLSVIQRRIQQKTRSSAPRNPHAVVSCPHANSLLFYEERLGQLEDKLKIYESSGDAQGILLAKRLQKEVELARRVKELTDKVASLEALNKKLEEEKCEFEEAENDARFQCQRLEVKLQELIDKNADLELEVERRKAMMSEEKRKERKKGSLEGLLNKYEKRNSELEEKEMEARRRLSMIEAAMPALVAYNVFKMVQKPEFEGGLPENCSDAFLVGKKPKPDESLTLERLEGALSEQKSEKTECEGVEESAAERERALRNKIRKLEAKAEEDRAALEDMTNSLKAYEEAAKSERGPKAARPEDVDLFEEVKQMVANEIELRAQIERLEKKEQAYMQSLEKADEIWAGMEADYKRRLLEAEEANNELQKRVSRLEKAQTELEKASARRASDADLNAPAEDVRMKILHLALENEKLKAEVHRASEENFEGRQCVLETENASLKEKLKKTECDLVRQEEKNQLLRKELELSKADLGREREVGERLRKDFDKKNQSVASMESDMQSQISKLTQELSQKSKELSSLEVTVAELREEVETLENKISELVETIQKMIKNQEEVSAVRVRSLHLGRPSPSGGALCPPVRADAPSPEEDATEDPGRAGPPPTADEILTGKVRNFSPCESHQQSTACFVGLASRQEIRFVHARCEIVKIVFLGTIHRLFRDEIKGVPKAVKQEKEFDPREDEIFQLSIKNTELQQMLERMDEEAKLKDKEFEELQKVAFEIRNEQENLLTLYGKAGKQEQTNTEESAPEVQDDPDADLSVTNSSMEFLQVLNPIIKNSDQTSASLSSLQIAFDNLQGKHRWNATKSGALVDDCRQSQRDRSPSEDNFVEQLMIDFPTDSEAEDKNVDDHAPLLNLEAAVGGPFDTTGPPVPSELTSAIVCPALLAPRFKRRSQWSDEDLPEFSFAAPITTVRKVGDDGIFLEWDVSQQPEEVVGFEVKVNGLLSHRVRSSTRNKALLRPLNLKDQISIHLFAVTRSGRSSKSSYVSYSDDVSLRREESPFL